MLVKLCVAEDGTDTMAEQAAASDAIAVCRIAWVEIMAAMARRGREQPKDAAAITRARKRVVADGPHGLTLDVTQRWVRWAGDCADAFASRAHDSVQLAAAHILRQELPGEVRFSWFDNRLIKAARVLGIEALG